MSKVRDVDIAQYNYAKMVGGKCPFCGRPLMRGQNGWYCTCPKWNAVQMEARRRMPYY